MADDGAQRDDVRSRLREALIGVMIDKVRKDRFPSATMMDLIEQNLDEDQLDEYGQVLLDKIADDRFPSYDMIKRLVEFV
jgi:hypothetical protein